jgi:hypothetical protein
VPASSGRTRITPLSVLPFPPEHGRSPDPPPLLCPGGGAPSDGHGALVLAGLGGFDLGGFGSGVFVTGRGVGAGVTRGVGAGVTCGVGADVGAALRAGVGPESAAGVPGPGDGETAAGLGATDGLGSIDGDGLATDGLAVACGWLVGPVDGDAGPWVSGAVVGAGVDVGTVGIWAMGPADAAARCCSSAPPIPSAIDARTRFRTPRLRMSRVR